jgi:hypothetical protein
MNSKEQLKLWKIELNTDTATPNWDVYDSFVICAYSEKQVRRMAAENSSDEGPKVWLESNLSYVVMIANTTCLNKTQIVISSFNAG